MTVLVWLRVVKVFHSPWVIIAAPASHFQAESCVVAHVYSASVAA